MGLLGFVFAFVVSSLTLGGIFYLIDMALNKSQTQNAKNTGPAAGKTGELLLGVISLIALCILLIRNWPQLWSLLRSFWQGLPGFIFRWDVLAFIILSGILSAANLEVQKQSGAGRTLASFKHGEDEDYKNRTYYINLFNYSAAALKDASSSYITAVSILIPASFVIIQVAKSPGPAKTPAGVLVAMPLVFQGVVWFLFSLFFGILTLYRVFTHGRYQDLTRSFPVTVLLIVQLTSLFVGVLSLAAGLYYVASGDRMPAVPVNP